MKTATSCFAEVNKEFSHIRDAWINTAAQIMAPAVRNYYYHFLANVSEGDVFFAISSNGDYQEGCRRCVVEKRDGVFFAVPVVTDDSMQPMEFQKWIDTTAYGVARIK